MSPIQLGNFYYFLPILIAIGVTILLQRALKNQSKKFIERFLMYILLSGLTVHFLKVLLPDYTYELLGNQNPARKVTFENICAVSTLLFPLIYLSKNKLLKDYMVLVGMVSGLVSFIFPVVVWGDQVKSFGEILRFYFAHYVIFIVPYLMAIYKIHDLNPKNVFKLPLLLLGVLFIIYINEVIVVSFGWSNPSDLYDVEGTNPSLVFGMSEAFSKAGTFVTVLVPKFLKYNPFADKGYFPVLWMFIPVMIYGTIIALAGYFIFSYQSTKEYVKKGILVFRKDDKEFNS